MPKRVRAHVNPLSITHETHFEGFSNTAGIFVDVGAYKGEFIDQLSEKFPQNNFLCLEIRKPVAQKLREKFAERDNFAVFDGDAGLNFQNLLGPSLKKGVKIEAVTVNFPDPWFKEKHKKRRFINEKFLEHLATWFPKKSPIIFQTDQEFLFRETEEVLDIFGEKIDREYFTDSAFGISTDWESTKMEQGEKIFRMKFWFV